MFSFEMFLVWTAATSRTPVTTVLMGRSVLKCHLASFPFICNSRASERGRRPPSLLQRKILLWLELGRKKVMRVSERPEQRHKALKRSWSLEAETSVFRGLLWRLPAESAPFSASAARPTPANSRYQVISVVIRPPCTCGRIRLSCARRIRDYSDCIRS